MNTRVRLLTLVAFVASPLLFALWSSGAQAFDLARTRSLTRTETEKLLMGARISLVEADGAVRSWTHNPGGKLIASLVLPASATSRSVNGQGTARIDDSGAYCVRIEWPRTLESWCRRVVALGGDYYSVGEEGGSPQLYPLKIVQPDPARLSLLSRLVSLARITAGAVSR